MRTHRSAFHRLSDFDGGAAEKPDHDAELKAAFDGGYHQGLAEGRAEAQADGELKLAEARTLFAEKLEDEREVWQRDCADALAVRFDGAIKLIQRGIEDRVAVLLRPWLIEQVRTQALQDLEKAIGRALAEGARVHIEAPPGVLEHLKGRLPADGFHIGYSESASPDIRAVIGETEIEANISAWVAELEALTS